LRMRKIHCFGFSNVSNVCTCTKRDQPLTYDYNFIIEKGDEIVEGRYYKQLGRKETSFVMM
jgi:hypothetical protein